MTRLFAVLLLVVCAACDRSTPRMTPPPTLSPTPTVELSSPRAGATPAPAALGMPRPPPGAQRSHVQRVTDGDTVVLSNLRVGAVDRATGGRKSRLIGIDTPEVFGRSECFGREASAFTHAALDGKDVLVDLDVQAVDRYGRALVYIWQTDGTFFNGRLVAEGYAEQATFPPNVRYVELFTRLAREAREANLGLWSVCR